MNYKLKLIEIIVISIIGKDLIIIKLDMVGKEWR